MDPAQKTASAFHGRWTRIIRGFERVVVVFLMSMLMVIISISVLELAWMLVRDLSTRRPLLLDVEEVFELFGFFLLVLIGVDLLTTLKAYVTEGVIHAEAVLEVALIAVAQKVVVLDMSRTHGLSLIGLSALILALSAAFWSVRAVRRRE